MKVTPLGNQLELRVIPFTVVPRVDDPRSPGLHQSDIVKAMMKEMYPKRFDTGAGMNWDKISIGLLVEAVVEEALKALYPAMARPGELVVEAEGGPIYVTPDGYDPDHDANVEIKGTWYSAASDILDKEKFWPWHLQMMTGCYALSCTTAYLHVLFINGDYKPPSPWLHSYRFDFTPMELIECVECLDNFARDRGLREKNANGK